MNFKSPFAKLKNFRTPRIKSPVAIKNKKNVAIYAIAIIAVLAVILVAPGITGFAANGG